MSETKKLKRKKMVHVDGQEFVRDPTFINRLRESFLDVKTKGKLAEKRRRARKKAGVAKPKKAFGQ